MGEHKFDVFHSGKAVRCDSSCHQYTAVSPARESLLWVAKLESRLHQKFISLADFESDQCRGWLVLPCARASYPGQCEWDTGEV